MTMSLQRNYYEVLGPAAQCHHRTRSKRSTGSWPGNIIPISLRTRLSASDCLPKINQAYRVLADPERRAQYNTTLDSPVRSVAPAPSPAAAPNRPAPASAPQAAAQSAPNPQKAQAIAQLLGNADGAIMASKPLEARGFCMKVLEIEAKNLRALVLMGDALVMMGQPRGCGSAVSQCACGWSQPDDSGQAEPFGTGDGVQQDAGPD